MSDRQELIELLRENLRIEIESTREYSGDMDGSGNLYSTHSTIKLVFDGEIISEASL
jgi:hypothetical protein